MVFHSVYYIDSTGKAWGFQIPTLILVQRETLPIGWDLRIMEATCRFAIYTKISLYNINESR